MCCPNGDDSISSGPRTTVGTSIKGTGAASKAGCLNGSNGAVPPSHAGMFSGARSDCRLSLLNSLRTRQGMPPTDRLERCGGLFLDSTSTLFFGGGRSGSGELPEDNSSSAAALLSSGRIGSLPLFCLTRGARWLLPAHFRLVHPLDESAGGRFPAVDGQHGSTVRPSVWPVPPASPPYPDTSEGTDL